MNNNLDRVLMTVQQVIHRRRFEGRLQFADLTARINEYLQTEEHSSFEQRLQRITFNYLIAALHSHQHSTYQHMAPIILDCDTCTEVILQPDHIHVVIWLVKSSSRIRYLLIIYTVT